MSAVLVQEHVSMCKESVSFWTFSKNAVTMPFTMSKMCLFLVFAFFLFVFEEASKNRIMTLLVRMCHMLRAKKLHLQGDKNRHEGCGLHE